MYAQARQVRFRACVKKLEHFIIFNLNAIWTPVISLLSSVLSHLLPAAVVLKQVGLRLGLRIMSFECISMFVAVLAHISISHHPLHTTSHFTRYMTAFSL
jgi:hypothetical protein